ncbi:MAG: hypothetical protein HQK99_06050 [Nitrospirae bacterium]|nr:hypothetical protein [Nitrospirota bacterium]
MSDACYIKDPKTGRFLGRKPGCSNNTGEVPEKLLQKVAKDKGVIERRVDAAAASGKLQRQDSAVKDKAEELARAVNSGKMSYPEALYELTKGSRSSGRYGRAIDLLDRDASYWNSIRSKTGSDEVDTLIGGYAGAPVPGATDFALNLSGGKSGMQEISDQEPQIPSGATRKQLDAQHEKWTGIIKERHHPDDSKSIDKRGVYDKNKHTNCHGNECDTQASVYAGSLHGSPTSSGTIHDKHGYTAAMPPTYVGKLDRKKPIYAEVTNKANGEKVIVKVDDKGPFPVRDKDPNTAEGKKKSHEDPTRAIDLSAAAYAKIAKNPGDGVLNVTVKFLKPEDGERKYKEQNEWAAKHEPEIKQKVQDALCTVDRAYHYNKDNKCP